MDKEIIEVITHNKEGKFQVKFSDGKSQWMLFDELLKLKGELLVTYLEKQVHFRVVEEDKLY